MSKTVLVICIILFVLLMLVLTYSLCRVSAIADEKEREFLEALEQKELQRRENDINYSDEP